MNRELERPNLILFGRSLIHLKGIARLRLVEIKDQRKGKIGFFLMVLLK